MMPPLFSLFRQRVIMTCVLLFSSAVVCGSSYNWVVPNSDFCKDGVCGDNNLTISTGYYLLSDWFCLSGDTCINTWPAGGGGGGLVTVNANSTAYMDTNGSELWMHIDNIAGAGVVLPPQLAYKNETNTFNASQLIFWSRGNSGENMTVYMPFNNDNKNYVDGMELGYGGNNNYQSGLYGSEKVFDGSDNLQGGTYAPFDMTTNSLTVAFFINPDMGGAGPYGRIFTKKENDGSGLTGYEVRYDKNDATPRMYSYYNGTTNLCISNTDLADNVTQHVAFVWDRAENMSMYINGAKTCSVNFTNKYENLWNTGLFFFMSNLATSNFVKGNIDELKVWKRALTEQEMVALISSESEEQGYAFTQTPKGRVSTYGRLFYAQYEKDFDDVASQYECDVGIPHGHFVEGVLGQGVSLNGVDEYLWYNDTDALDFDIGNFSAMGWLKLNSGTGQAGFFGKGAYIDGWEVRVGTGISSFIRQGNNVIKICNWVSGLKIGIWTHIGIVKEGSNVKQYVNGVYDSTCALINESIIAASRSFEVGINKYNAEYVNGTVDEIMVFNRSLHENEIRGVYELNTDVYNQHDMANVRYAYNSFLGDINVMGNIGVGTTTPSHKLTVVGDMNITENITMASPDGANWNCGVSNAGTFSCS